MTTPTLSTADTFDVPMPLTGMQASDAMVLGPQAAILAVGAPHENGQLTLTLTCDHRAINGASAARFLVEVVRQLDGGDSS